MSIFTDIGGFFANIGQKISGWFQKEQPVVQKAYTDANNVINIAKSLLGSATGQTIELVIEALAPGAANVVFGALNTLFTDWGWVSTEVAKPLSQIAADGINKAATLIGDSKTSGLHTIAAVVGNALANHNGGTSTLQQALTTIGLVHNPAILDAPTPIVSPTPETGSGSTVPNVQST